MATISGTPSGPVRQHHDLATGKPVNQPVPVTKTPA